MAITLYEIERLLEERDLHYLRADGRIVLQWETEKYRDRGGESTITAVIALDEDGEYVSCSVPFAFEVTTPTLDVVARAVLILQNERKAIRFWFDPADGELRVVIDFPLEDGTIRAHQLHRILRLLVDVCEDEYEFLATVVTEGVLPERGDAADRPPLAGFDDLPDWLDGAPED